MTETLKALLYTSLLGVALYTNSLTKLLLNRGLDVRDNFAWLPTAEFWAAMLFLLLTMINAVYLGRFVYKKYIKKDLTNTTFDKAYQKIVTVVIFGGVILGCIALGTFAVLNDVR